MTRTMRNPTTIKRRSSSILMPLIASQRRRIAKQGFLVEALQTVVDRATKLRGTAPPTSGDQMMDEMLAEALAKQATLQARLESLLAELDR